MKRTRVVDGEKIDLLPNSELRKLNAAPGMTHDELDDAWIEIAEMFRGMSRDARLALMSMVVDPDEEANDEEVG